MSNYERTNLSSLGFQWAAVSNHKNQEKTNKKGKTNKNAKTISKSSSCFSLEKSQNSKKLNKQKTNELEEHWSKIIDKMNVDKIPVVLYIQVANIYIFNLQEKNRCTIVLDSL